MSQTDAKLEQLEKELKESNSKVSRPFSVSTPTTLTFDSTDGSTGERSGRGRFVQNQGSAGTFGTQVPENGVVGRFQKHQQVDPAIL